MKSLKVEIDKTKTYTQSAYAKKINESPQLIRSWVLSGKLKTVKINGATLVVE